MAFLKGLLGRGQPASSAVAKERLQLVLVHDRVQLSPQTLQDLKDDLIETISRYIAIDRDAVQISLTQNRRESRLVADIPLTRAARPRSRS
jgi:cell division topological specificity factor